MPANTYARGVSKIVTVAQEASFGSGAAGASGAQQLRRTSSDLSLSINAIESQEILPSQQMRDARQGPRRVQGTISGQLSPSTYKLLFQNLLRANFTAGKTTASITDAALAVTGTSGTLTSAAVNFLTFSSGDGIKKGDIIRFAGLTGPVTADNAENFRVTSVASGSVGFAAVAAGETLTAFASGQTADTVSVAGKKLTTPPTGQIFTSLALEHYFSDVGISELFVGCQVTGITLNIPASGFVTLQASVIGQNAIINNAAGAAQISGASAPTTTTGLTATGGFVMYQGTPMAYITAANLQIQASTGADPVVGSNIVPFIFMGSLTARGTFSCFLTASDTMTADFLAENEVDLSFLLTTSPNANADFVQIYLPRCKLFSATKSDSDKAIVRSYSFTALEQTNTSGTGQPWDQTTVVVQDSLA